MPHIVATERALWWAVGNPVIETGITPVGALTVSGLPIVSAADENEFLAAVAGSASDYNPLPEMGEWVEAGFYGWGDGLVIVRQSHVRRNDPDDEGVGALFGLYRPGVDVWEWVAGEALEVGARRSYEGVVYELYRDVGANNWAPPPQNPAHWKVFVGEDEWPEWVQPTGAHDAYNIGDCVTFEGGLYESLINGNVWSPTAYPSGWQYIGPAT